MVAFSTGMKPGTGAGVQACCRYIFVILFLAQSLVPANAARLLAADGSSKVRGSHKPDLHGLRVELTRIDSVLMDGETLRSAQRLKYAVQQSALRTRMLAGRLKAGAAGRSASSSSSFSSANRRGDVAAAPVYSSANGAYILKLALGTPPQPFVGILDTGSDLVWRQSQPCTSCFKENDPYFDPSKSYTYNDVSCGDSMCMALPLPACGSDNGCEYYYSYGDGSSTMGALASDAITVGGMTSHGFVFGAGEDNSGDIGQVGCDGLVGMGGGPLSLPSQLANTIGSKFSYCLVTWTDPPSKTSPLLFGSAADLSGNNIKTTPFASVPSSPTGATFYYITLNGISVGGQLLDIPKGTFDVQPDGSGGFIIDSGTTITMLVGAAYKPLRAAYASAIKLPPKSGSSVGLDLCFDNSNNATVHIPTLTFHLEGADIDFPPENIFFDYQGYFCLAFLNVDSVGGGTSINIFGNTQQQNFQILYDKTSNNQLSFKPVTCDSL